MHEFSIAEHVVRIASERSGGRQVTKVHMRVGHLRQVVPSALAFGFELASARTPAEGAALEMEEVPATGLCRGCGARNRFRDFPLRCGTCGGLDSQILAGEELIVDSIEVEEG